MDKITISERVTTTDMEMAVAKYFNFRINIIVPNVCWGLNIHEVDLLILTPANYAYEIEIKTTRSDLRADLKKRHKHINTRISKLYFAIPFYLQCSTDLIPKHAGILIVTDGRVECVRDPQRNGKYKFTDKERYHLLHLGAMRIWKLKQAMTDKDVMPNKSTYGKNKVNKDPL